MSLVYSDRVREATITAGTGSYSLSGAVVGYQTFVDAVGAGNTCYYQCTDGTDWEIGIGTVTSSPDTLIRTTILSSSNGDLAVSWGAGTREVFITVPAAFLNSLGTADVSPTPQFQSVVSSGNIVANQSGIFTNVVVGTGAADDTRFFRSSTNQLSLGNVANSQYGELLVGKFKVNDEFNANNQPILNAGAIGATSLVATNNIIANASGIFGKGIVASGDIFVQHANDPKVSVGQPSVSEIVMQFLPALSRGRVGTTTSHNLTFMAGNGEWLTLTNGGEFRPTNDNYTDFGNASARIKKGWFVDAAVSNNLVVGNSGIFGKDLISSGDIYSSKVQLTSFAGHSVVKSFGGNSLILADQDNNYFLSSFIGGLTDGANAYVSNLVAARNLVAYSSGIFGKDLIASGNITAGVNINAVTANLANNVNFNGWQAVTNTAPSLALAYPGSNWNQIDCWNRLYVMGNVVTTDSGIFGKGVVASGTVKSVASNGNSIYITHDGGDGRITNDGTLIVSPGNAYMSVNGTVSCQGNIQATQDALITRNVIANSSGIFAKDLIVSGDITFSQTGQLGSYFGYTALTNMGGNGFVLAKGGPPILSSTPLAYFNASNATNAGNRFIYRIDCDNSINSVGNIFSQASGIFGKDVIASGNIYASGSLNIGGNINSLYLQNIIASMSGLGGGAGPSGGWTYVPNPQFQTVTTSGNLLSYSSGIFQKDVIASGQIHSSNNIVSYSSGIFAKDVVASGSIYASVYFQNGSAAQEPSPAVFYGNTGNNPCLWVEGNPGSGPHGIGWRQAGGTPIWKMMGNATGNGQHTLGFGYVPGNHFAMYLQHGGLNFNYHSGMAQSWTTGDASSSTTDLRQFRQAAKTWQLDDSADGPITAKIIGQLSATRNILGFSSGIFQGDVVASGNIYASGSINIGGNINSLYLQNIIASMSGVGGGGGWTYVPNPQFQSVLSSGNFVSFGSGIFAKHLIASGQICSANNVIAYASGIFQKDVIASGQVIASRNVVGYSSGIFTGDVIASGRSYGGSGLFLNSVTTSGKAFVGPFLDGPYLRASFNNQLEVNFSNSDASYASVKMNFCSNNGIVPNADNTYDIGDATTRYRSLALSRNIISNGSGIFFRDVVASGQFRTSNNVVSFASGIFQKDVVASGQVTASRNIVGYSSGIFQSEVMSSGNINTKTFCYNTLVDDGNTGTSKTIDWTTGNKHKATLTGACTFTFTAPTNTANLTLRLIQDGTGSRTVTWPAAVKWAGGAAPTLTTTAAGIDIVNFYYEGTTYYGAAGLGFA